MRKFLSATTLAMALGLGSAAFADTVVTQPPAPVTSPNLYDESEPRANAQPVPGSVVTSPDGRWYRYEDRDQLAYGYPTPPITVLPGVDPYEYPYGKE